MNDFDENRIGTLSTRQRRFLSYQLILRLVLLDLIAIPVSLEFVRTDNVAFDRVPFNIIGWVVLVGAITMTILYLWQYVNDIFINKPVTASGLLKKYRKKRLRGPDHYCIRIDKHQLYNPEFYTTPEIWEALQDNQPYTLYFARNTKWLLSWQSNNL